MVIMGEWPVLIQGHVQQSVSKTYHPTANKNLWSVYGLFCATWTLHCILQAPPSISLWEVYKSYWMSLKPFIFTVITLYSIIYHSTITAVYSDTYLSCIINHMADDNSEKNSVFLLQSSALHFILQVLSFTVPCTWLDPCPHHDYYSFTYVIMGPGLQEWLTGNLYANHN